MKKIKDLVKQSVQETAALSKTSPTAAGRVEDEKSTAILIDTINQVFSLFRINYHNQYHAAFGDTVLLNQAKRLWKEALQSYGSPQILRAARRIIEESEYLPTLHKMLNACDAGFSEFGLPNVRSAYLEAANAANPKNAQDWSHPAVYLAGRQVGWYELSHQGENITYAAYAKAYKALARKALNGEKFAVDAPAQISQKPGKPADPKTVRRELQALKDILAEE